MLGYSLMPDSTIWTPHRAARRRSRHGPPLCSTTFGGSTVPPLFSGSSSGGGGTFGGYVFSSFTELFIGNSSLLNNAQRTLAVSAGVGDLIVAFAMAGPGYGGQASLTLRTPTFAVYSSTGGVLQFDSGVSRFVSGIQPRIATGDSEDNCLIFGIGQFPIYLGCAVFSGNPYTFGLGSITSDNENSQIDNAANNNIFRENGPPGGAAITVKCFSGCKQLSTAQSGDSVSNTDQGIIALSLTNVGENGFGDGAIYACGYKFEELPIDTATGNWPLTSTWTGDEFSLEATFRSGDS